jgi:hypothetical protein
MKKIAWEIMVICPSAERNYSRGGCMNRASMGQQLDEVIEQIRKLMLKSAQETANDEKLSRREIATTSRQQQQQQRHGAGRQLQRVVWDPGGFQQPGWRAHE